MKGDKQMNFEEIYQSTYKRTLKYIICKCTNIEDVNDLIQETNVELYRNLKKGKIKIESIEAYIIGIAHNRIRKYYGKKQRNKVISIPFKEEISENKKELQSDIDLERDIVTKENAQKVWNYLKNKNTIIAKIFYLYYGMDCKISDIAKELEMSESNVKNNLYRTLKELRNVFRKEGEESE